MTADTLRKVSLISIAVASTGAFGLTMYVGRNNPSLALMMMFMMWVLSPFVAALIVDTKWEQWTGVRRESLYALMILISVVSLVVFSFVAFGPPMAKPAAPFLLVPAAEWILVAAVVLKGVLKKRKSNKGSLQ